jgi:hypothetical protein
VVYPAQVFAFAAFVSGRAGAFSPPARVASRTAYALAPDVTGWPGQSQEARTPATMAGAQP